MKITKIEKLTKEEIKKVRGGINVNVKDVTPVPHNGMRPPKHH